MRLTRSARSFAIGVAVALGLAVAGGSPAAAAPASTTDRATTLTVTTNRATIQATWQLARYEQRICTPPDFARRNLYFFLILDGTWSTPVSYGLSNLPAGSVSLPGSLEPGSGDGHVVQRLVAFDLPPTPVGRYTPDLWASDGVSTQRVPVIIDVQTSC